MVLGKGGNVARHLKLRLLACTAFAALMTLIVASVASADTQVGMQDPNTTVTVSLKSSGMDPNVASIGDKVTASVSVKASNFFTLLDVHLFVFGDWTGTKAGVEKDKLLRLKPGKTWDWEAKFKVRQTTPLGAFSLSALAITPEVFDPSSATATITAVARGVDTGDETVVLEENDAGDDD
jgi:hypothetical protein